MIRGIQDEMKGALAAVQAGVGSVERGVQSTTAAGGSLQEIIGMSGRVSEVIAQTDQTASRQSGAAEEISSRVSQIAKIARETASGAGESAEAVQELSNPAFDL